MEDVSIDIYKALSDESESRQISNVLRDRLENRDSFKSEEIKSRGLLAAATLFPLNVIGKWNFNRRQKYQTAYMCNKKHTYGYSSTQSADVRPILAAQGQVEPHLVSSDAAYHNLGKVNPSLQNPGVAMPLTQIEIDTLCFTTKDVSMVKGQKEEKNIVDSTFPGIPFWAYLSKSMAFKVTLFDKNGNSIEGNHQLMVQEILTQDLTAWNTTFDARYINVSQIFSWWENNIMNEILTGKRDPIYAMLKCKLQPSIKVDVNFSNLLQQQLAISEKAPIAFAFEIGSETGGDVKYLRNYDCLKAGKPSLPYNASSEPWVYFNDIYPVLGNSNFLN